MPEKVLLVCTSTESNVNKALRVLKEHLFQNPQVDILCTSADLHSFESKADLGQVFVFPHRRNLGAALRLWRRLFKERYDVVTVLWCLDLGRVRSKFFALCCGGRRILVFNENLDCDYLGLGFLKRLVVARAHNGTLTSNMLGHALFAPLRDGYWGLIRLVIFPLRLFIILLAVAGLYLGKTVKGKM